jgi:hypothetical protein
MNDADIGQEPKKVRHSSLLNRSEVRKFVLDTFRRTRPHLGITRVSAGTLETLEGWLRERIRSQIHSHPSVGRTAKF